MSITYGTVASVKADDTAHRNPYSMGYGAKIPTRFWVKLTGGPKWRRVYAMQYGNAASLYVTVKGRDVFIHDTDLEVATA